MRPLPFIALYGACMMSSFGMAQNPNLSDPAIVAQIGYKEFIQSPLQQKTFCADHGITEEDLKGAITLGTPYRLQCMTPQHVFSYSTRTPACQLAENTDIYMFPVLFNGQPKLFMDVCNFSNDHFEIGSIGQSWLCQEMAAIAAVYPRSTHAIQLIQNYQTGRYLVHIPQIDEHNLMILEPGLSKTRGYGLLPSAAQTMPRMKALLDETLEQWQ